MKRKSTAVLHEDDMEKLRGRIVDQIDRYLERKATGPEVSSWAAGEYIGRTFTDREVLYSAALRSLMTTGGDLAPDLFDDGLRQLKAALLGQRDYVMRFRIVPTRS